MKEFLNILNDYIVVLDKNFHFKFCNESFLKEVCIEKNNTHKFILDSSIEEELIDSLKYKNEYTTILKVFIDNTYLKLYSKLIKHIQDEEVIYYVYVYKIEKSNFEICQGKANDRIEKELNNQGYYIELLEDIKSKLKSDDSIEDIFKNIDVDNLINELINIIHKGELMQKDIKLFLNLSADFIGTLDKEGNLVMLDDSCSKIIGWEPYELTNKNILNFIHHSHRDSFKECLSEITTKVTTIENRVKCKDGRYKWLRWNMKNVIEVGLVAVTVRDISIEKKEEKRMMKLKQEIESENLKNQFFANLSHEFRTPLNIILGAVQLLDMNINKGKIHTEGEVDIDSYAKLIKQNSYRLLRMVNNLIDMSKIDAGYYKLELNSYDIVNVVEEISLSVAEYAKEKNINLIFDTDCEELVITCDPDKIERILLNLLSNSIKNTDSGGTIYVNINTEINRVNISVEDNGHGIPDNKLPKIFNRFEQVDDLLIRNYEGSGIGLSLVKSLVNMHGGDISVKSKVGIGTIFDFSIPNDSVNSCEIRERNNKLASNKIEKCDIEFSDIYK